MSLLTLVTPVLGKAAAGAFGAALPHLLNPWTRSRVLKLLDDELRAGGATPDQARDLIGRVKDDQVLKRIARLRDPREVHQLIAQAVQPHGVTDPQHTEALLLTRALLAALLQATSPTTNAGLMSGMLLNLYLTETLPELGAVVREAQRRRKHPILSATSDLADVLRRAGQHGMSVTVGADESVTLSGQARVSVKLSGANAERFEQWRQGKLGASVQLSPSDGDVQVSYGHEELDRMFLPDVPRERLVYEFWERPLETRVRVRVTAPGATTVHCDVDFSYRPRSQVLELTFGEGTMHFSVILTPREGKTTNVRMNLSMDSEDRLLPLAFRPVLRAMRLLARPDMQVVLPVGTTLPRSVGSNVNVGVDTVLFDGQIWGKQPMGSDEPNIPEYLDAVSELHLLTLDIAQALEERHGVDLKMVCLPSEWSDQAVLMLRIAADVMNDRAVPTALDFEVDAVGETLDQMRATGTVMLNLEMTNMSALDFGACVLRVDSPVSDLRLDPETGRVTGMLTHHTVTVLPAGAFDELMAEPSMTVLDDEHQPIDSA